MQRLVVIGLASLLLGFSAAGAVAAGNMGGPSDAWGSPYVLYIPQLLQQPYSTEGRAAYVGESNRTDCHGDKACERREKEHGAAAPQ